MYSKRDHVLAAFILLATFGVFCLGPIHTVYDSRYTMFFGERLLWNHSFAMNPNSLRPFQGRQSQLQHECPVDLPCHFVQLGARFYYFFPPGSVVLSVPYIALANAMGISATDENGMYDEGGETRIQKRLAALLMAGLSTAIFLTSRLILPPLWSLLVTADAAFGTQVWSIASRAVWSHTWGIFLLGLALWLLFRTETKQARLHPMLLATCLSWLYFVRPTFAPSIAAIAIYLLIYHGKKFPRFAATGLVWLALFIGYSERLFGQLLPPYYQADRLGSQQSFWEAFSGVLISPSRGLLIYVPVLIFVGYLLIRYGRDSRKRLVTLAAAAVLGHLIAISLFFPWHGGHCYGPRLATDIVPWCALLAILALDARLRWRELNPSRDSIFRVRSEFIIALLLLAASITLHAIGATSPAAWRWNMLPTNIDQDHARLWDWRHPQFMGAPRSTTPLSSQSTPLDKNE